MRRTRDTLLKAGTLVFGFLLASIVNVAAQANLPSYAGGYNGTGAANGMAMILEQDGAKVFGRIVDGQSNVFDIVGEASAEGVEGKLRNDKVTAGFELELRPTGIQFVFIPLDREGRPAAGGQKRYTFTRGPVRHHALANYRVPPPQQGDRVDVVLFLENYRTWSDAEMAVAYDGVPAGDRAVMRFFDHFQADLMARLCRAGADEALIREAGENQQLNCKGLLLLMAEAEDSGALRQFQDLAEYQRSSIYTVVACDRQLLPAGRCTNISKISSRASMSWRDASLILKDYIDDRRGRAATRAADAAKDAGEETVALSDAAPSPSEGSEATSNLTPAEALLKRLRLPRTKPAALLSAAKAEAEKIGSAIAEVTQASPAPMVYVPLKSKRMPQPRFKPLDAQLASAEQPIDTKALSSVQQPEPEETGADATVAAASEARVVKLPRKKPRRFVPEALPKPKERPAATAG